MVAMISLGEVAMEVTKKDIKNIHLSVYPPNGKVKIAAPNHMRLDTIRVYAISKLGWIKQQQKKFQAQERETPRDFLDRESHYLWGKRYSMRVVEKDSPPVVELKHRNLILQVRARMDKDQKKAILEKWYRDQIREAAKPLFANWTKELGVRPGSLYVQRMRTKWGSCNAATKSIRLNSELAKKSPECLEYIVVHELVHLLEPTHNLRFHTLMDRHLPQWKHYRKELNRAPLAYEHWEY